MRGCLFALVIFAGVFITTANTSAQTVVVAPPAHVVYSPVVPAYPPVVVQSAPVVTAYSPVVVAPPAPAVITYRPVVPVVAYRPVVTSYGGPAYVPAGRPVVMRTKVYVPGQPVRNLFRAIAP